MTDAAVDPLYVATRRVLLDALDALAEHRSAVILVGAQAIYAQTGEADLDASVAPFTTDADLSIEPGRLGADPRLVEAMTAAGFTLKEKVTGGVEPGTWLASTTVDGEPAPVSIPVDLLVPEALALSKGRRDARLPNHGRNAARWTPGLEATVFDSAPMTIRSLEPERDSRSAEIRVAGPAALLIAKAHKVIDRLHDADAGRDRRVKPKDCGDIIRLMRSAESPTIVGARLAELARNDVCGPSVVAGVKYLRHLFGGPRSAGVDLAVAALAQALPEDELRALAPAYLDALLAAYQA